MEKTINFGVGGLVNLYAMLSGGEQNCCTPVRVEGRAQYIYGKAYVTKVNEAEGWNEARIYPTYSENRMESKKIYSSAYVQNCTNWCWAVACRMVGEQFIRTLPAFNLSFFYNIRICINKEGTQNEKNTGHLYWTGIRTDVVRQENGVFLLDKTQCSIVKNANTVCPFRYGNWPGDDEAKERGIKFVVTGNCDSDLIHTASLGFYDSEDSLLDQYLEQIRNVFLHNNYIIGNAILYPRGISHSFVLLDWTLKEEILVYDPWDGNFAFSPVKDVFGNGMSSALGTGVVKWLQFIK